MRIFHSRLGTDDSGFPLVPEPLPEPTKMQPLPKGFAFLEHPETARFSGSGLPEFPLFSSRTEPMTVSPFKGGETEALIRLRRKVSQRTDFVNSFRKPKTFSTNEPTDPLEPSTTGLSPYLSVGCLSVRRFWKEVEACNRKSEHSLPPESLHGQLLFREMFYLLSRTVRNWDRDLDNPMCKPIRWGEKDEFEAKGMGRRTNRISFHRRNDETTECNRLDASSRAACGFLFSHPRATLATLAKRKRSVRTESHRQRLGSQQCKLVMAFRCGSLFHAILQALQPLPRLQIQSQRGNQNRPFHQAVDSRTPGIFLRSTPTNHTSPPNPSRSTQIASLAPTIRIRLWIANKRPRKTSVNSKPVWLPEKAKGGLEKQQIPILVHLTPIHFQIGSDSRKGPYRG